MRAGHPPPIGSPIKQTCAPSFIPTVHALLVPPRAALIVFPYAAEVLTVTFQLLGK